MNRNARPPGPAPTVLATSAVVRVDRERVPNGRQVRHLTAQIQDARQGRGWGAVVSEVWYTIVTIGLCLAFVAGITSTVQQIAAQSGGAVVGQSGRALSGDLPGALVALAAAGAVLSLAGRLGPVGVGGGGAGWWLPMPVERRGLLRWTVLAWPAAAGAVGVVIVPAVVAALAGRATVGGALGWSAVGGSVFALLVALAALGQTSGRRDGRLGTGGPGGVGGASGFGAVGELLMLTAAALVAVLALTTGTTAPDAGRGSFRTDLAGGWQLGGAWWSAVPLVAVAVVATVLAERRAGQIDGAGLRARGALGERAKVAVMALDLRELGRVLSSSGARARRRSVRWTGPVRLLGGGPRRVIVLADLLLLVRTPRLFGQITVAALLGIVVGRVELLRAGLPLYAVLVVLGFWAANAAVAGGRHAEMAPVLDRLLPLSAKAVRLTRGVVPLLATLVWSAVVLGVLALRSGLPEWLVIAPAWALVLATAAVRSAYRPPPNPSRVPISSPMGGVPNTGGMFKGLDVALVGTLPTALVLHADVLTPALVVAQWVAALAVVGIMAAVAGRKPSAGSMRFGQQGPAR